MVVLFNLFVIGPLVAYMMFFFLNFQFIRILFVLPLLLLSGFFALVIYSINLYFSGIFVCVRNTPLGQLNNGVFQ